MNLGAGFRAVRPLVAGLDRLRANSAKASPRPRVTPIIVCSSAPDRPPGWQRPHVHHAPEPICSCILCKPANILCFWTPRPSARWKRPVLALGALATILLSLVMAIVVEREFAEKINIAQPHRVLGHAVIGLSLFASGIAGLAVAAFGCDKCVSRLTAEF
jgi:hypothetical protein